MSTPEITLDTPLQLPCGATLSNRLAKAAMSEQLAHRDGTPSDKLRKLYAVWARSGASLLITGNIMIDRDALTEPGNVILDDPRALTDVRNWTNEVTATNTEIWAQLNHPGKVAVAPFNRRPVAPTASRHSVPGYNLRKPRELSTSEIAAIVQRFARSAELAIAGGFTGIQIHAAHGYLLSQFLSPLSNHRTDAYGGDPTRRMRLLLEVVTATRAVLDSTTPISVKLNSADFVHGGFSSDEALNVAKALSHNGIDLLEISGGGYEAPAMTGVIETDTSQEAYFAHFAAKVATHIDTPVMLTGGIRNPTYMRELISTRVADMVGIARPMAFSPNYPLLAIAGEQPHARDRAPGVGYRPLDGYLELAWHNNQLHRIASGKTPQRRPGARTLATSIARLSAANARQASIPR